MKKILGYVGGGVLWLLTTVGLDTPNRLVVVLSPLFVAAAGWISAELAKLVPGANLGPVEIMGVFVAGATFATTKVLVWLHGWHKWEAKPLPPPAPAGVSAVAGSALKLAPAPEPEPVHEVGRL